MVLHVGHFILILVIVGFHVGCGTLQCDCKKRNCVQPKRCRVGIENDMCNCCTVCAKEEGEICGGINNIEGECGDDLQCVFRRIPSSVNARKRHVGEPVGRCEYVKCHYKGCPFGQACTVINAEPTCVCPVCKDMDNGPICGESNNKQYNNECEMRLEECLTGIEIGIKDGLCNDERAVNVICDDEFMRIEVSKSYIGDVKGDQLTLLDDTCKLLVNETHIYRTVHFNECMTKSLKTPNLMIYSNTLRTYLSDGDFVQLPFKCEYPLVPRDEKVEHKSPVNGELMKKVPRRLHRAVNTDIKVDINHVETYLIEMQSKVFAKYNALLSPTFCYASPIEKSQRWMKYILIRRGCPIEDGVEILKAESPLIRMTVPSIKFREARYPGIVVKCRIRACFPKIPSDKFLCESSCPSISHIRRRRDSNSKKQPITVEYEDAEQRIII